jgi:hypothetical protein
MTQKAKELIDELEVVTKMNWEDKWTELVKKSAVIELVKELTKWNKVEDGLPEPITSIQMRKKNGYIGVGYMSVAMHQFYDYKSQTYFEISDVIEWKPIN